MVSSSFSLALDMGSLASSVWSSLDSVRLQKSSQMCWMLAKLRLVTASSSWFRWWRYISAKMATVS